MSLESPQAGAESAFFYRDVLERSPAIVFVGRADGSIAYVNTAWEAFSGLPSATLLEQGWIEVIHPDDTARVVDAWMGALAGGVAFREEFRLAVAGGEARWVVAEALPAFAAGGEASAWFGTIHEIDARRSAEHVLASLTDAMPQLILSCDAGGRPVRLNRRWIEYTGLGADVCCDAWLAAVHPEDAASLEAAWTNARATGTYHAEHPFRLRRRDGVYRWFVAHAVAVTDDLRAIVRWYVTYTDVDEQHRGSQRRAMLARLGSAFVESLDFGRTAQTIVTALCEDFADFAFIDSCGRDGRLHRIAVDAARFGGDAEQFRRLVPPPTATGHPINVALASGQPVTVATCDDAWIGQMSWSDDHAAFVRSLNLARVAFLPMVAAGQRVGVLTFGAVTDSGRTFSDADLDGVQEIVRQAAIALANAHLFADLTASEARYRGIIDTAQEGVWIVDAESKTRYVNQRLATMLGYSPDYMYGRSLYDFVTPEAQPAARRAFDVHREGGSERFEGTLVRADGQLLCAIISGSAILDAQGGFTGVLEMLTDITDRKAIETKYRLLTEATPQIIWTADARGKCTFINERWTTLTGMTREAALDYGWCDAVHADDLPKMLTGWRQARAGGGDFEAECRLRCSDGERYRWYLVRALARRDERGMLTDWIGSMTDIDATRRLSRVRDVVARAGDALNQSLDLETLLQRFAELLVAEVADEATIRLVDGRTIVNRRCELGADAPSLRATLVQRDAQLGTVILRKRAPFEDDERALLSELTARAGAAIDNTLLYEREHRVAVTLQRALLPALLPNVEGLDFDAVYYPGATDAEIGGDWYDAIALPDGRVVVSIGDVTGRGLTAAVIMGRTRQAIENRAAYETDPTRLLDAADAVLRRTHPDAIVTALVGVIDPASRTLVYATAGHPTPFVREPGGTVRRLPGRGLPLGLRDGRQPPPTTVVLPPWALALFYTDGLIESTRDIEQGERRVIDALRDPAVADGRSPATALVARVIEGAVRDDVAVMAVRVGDGPNESRPWTLRWRFDARDARRNYDVREAFVEALDLFGTDVDVAAAQLVFGELVSNAVRYTPGMVDVELDWLDPSTPVLHVVDDGPGFAIPDRLPAQDTERGRGLYLVSQLTREFRVWKNAARGAHACAVLASLAGRGTPDR